MKEKIPKIDLFSDLKKELLKFDPVGFAENYLTVDGNPINLEGGWSFWKDIYRYTSLATLKRDSKPLVVLKGRQVGCTNYALSMEMYFATSGVCGNKEKSPIRMVHCFPALSFVQKFAKEKLSNMIRTAKDNYIQKHLFGFDEDGKHTHEDSSTLFFKQFKNECRLMIESNANNAIRLQGSTSDYIAFDEVQHMYDSDIGNANRTLTASNYGSIGQGFQAYFGTPLSKGSYFHRIWESSDKRFYNLRCIECKEYFQLYEYESDNWEQIWVSGNIICCPHCQKMQNKSDAISGGKWVITQPKTENGDEPRYVGYHISQLLIPYLTKEAIIKEKPGIHPTNTDRVWKNEILGEFYSGSNVPMTQDIIYQKCRELDRQLCFGVSDSNINTFMGIDWGAKVDGDESSGGKSFSTFVIVSVDGAGTFRILNAFKLRKNDLDHKKEVVSEMFRMFNIRIAVADLGFANDTVPEIQKNIGSKFIGCMSNASLINPYKYDADDLRLMCNSNIVLEEVFNLMRKGKILFPLADFEKISWLIEHCCSMEKETKVINGVITNRFTKGIGPNDGLQSIMYAYLAYKFYQTRGFSIKTYKISDNRRQPIMIANLPRF